WQWANDPGVRAVSFRPEPIPWERHVAWYRARLADARCRFFIACDEGGTPVGQVRCDLDGDRGGTLSMSLAPEARGRGAGWRTIWAAPEEVFRTADVDRLHAFIKEDNLASLRAFARAGYRELQATVVLGQRARQWVLRRTEQ